MKRISVDGKELEIHSFTGKVLSATKSFETQVHGGGGGGYTNQGSGYTAPVRISSTTIVHDQLFLVSKDGKERAFQLQDFNVPLRESNQVTVVWAIKVGQQRGPYVTVYNHTTQEVRYHDNEIYKLVRPSAFGCAGIVLAALTAVYVFFGDTSNFSGLMFMAAVIGPPVWYWLKMRRRLKLFKASINPEEFAAE